MILFIEGKRNGYNINQCGNTMTVGEMIDFLSNYDNDTKIYLKNDNGYTFGNIEENSIEESFDDEEE